MSEFGSLRLPLLVKTMGATDGQLSYGCVFEEGFEFPWDDEKYEGDIDEWWEDVRGFTGTVDYPFDEFGEYKPGIHSGSPEVSNYFVKRDEWRKNNPLPIQLVNYCSGGYPMYILAVKHIEANRGYPKGIPSDYLIVEEEDRLRLLKFMEEFEIAPEGKIGWWLSSFKG